MGDPSLASVDHEARRSGERAFDLAQQAIKSVDDHEARCLRVNEAVWEELKTQRQDATQNHTAVLESIKGIHRNYDRTVTAIREVQVGQNEKIALQAQTAEQRATAFYKWVLSGTAGIIISVAMIAIGVWLK